MTLRMKGLFSWKGPESLTNVIHDLVITGHTPDHVLWFLSDCDLVLGNASANTMCSAGAAVRLKWKCCSAIAGSFSAFQHWISFWFAETEIEG